MEPPEKLTAALRQTTAALHKRVEQTAFVQALATGKITREAYAFYTAHLLALYQALEEALRLHETTPCCAGLLLPGLERTHRLRADLGVLGHPAPREWELSHRIRFISHSGEPERLLAHYYVRYFGDLSGGQSLARALRQVTGGEGLSFYDFSDGGENQVSVPILRNTLDGLPLSAPQRQRVLDEAVRSFLAHETLFLSMHP